MPADAHRRQNSPGSLVSWFLQTCPTDMGVLSTALSQIYPKGLLFWKPGVPHFPASLRQGLSLEVG